MEGHGRKTWERKIPHYLNMALDKPLALRYLNQSFDVTWLTLQINSVHAL